MDRNPYFRLRFDGFGKRGLSTHQKVTAALRVLAYGSSADSLDEYLQMAESTTNECVLQFCRTVIDVYGDRYLRAPTEDDARQLMAENATRGFPGMLGSIDCMRG